MLRALPGALPVLFPALLPLLLSLVVMGTAPSSAVGSAAREAGEGTQELAGVLVAAMAENRMGGEGGNRNTVVSPLGVHQSLALAQMGTAFGSESHAELAEMLNLKARDAKAETAVVGALHGALQGTAQGPLVLANSVWSRAGVLPTYKARAREALDAGAQDMPADAGPINAWVADKTNGLITELLSDAIVADPYLLSVLLNAVYFKAAWAEKFDPLATEKDAFQGRDGTVIPDVPYMQKVLKQARVAQVPVPGPEPAVAVALPYADADYRAVLLLPPPDMDVNQMAAYLFGPAPTQDGDGDGACATRWCGTVSSLDEARPSRGGVQVKLPKFKLESEIMEIKVLLEKAGLLKHAILPKNEFTRMTDDPRAHIESILQKATIEFSEEGTEASAATATLVTTRSMPPRPMVVEFTRPFVAVVEHVPTHTVAFAAIVEDPTQSSSA